MRLAGIQRVAVLRANALGDFIFALPALEALRAAYPEARITLLALAWHRDFLAGRPSPVDEVVVIPGDGLPDALPRGQWAVAPWLAADAHARERFFGRMRARSFDLAIQLHGGGGNSNPFVRALGAAVTAGMQAHGAPALDRTLPYAYYQSEAARCMEVIGLVGAPPVTLAPRLSVTAHDRAEARQLVDGSSPYAVLHSGAADPRRRWPPERFAEVGDWLARLGLAVVLTGSASESETVRALAAAMNRPALDLSGRTSTRALAGILARARVVITNDSGPMHLAVAVGAPTVGIYWVGNLINGGPLTRAFHRPVISWRTECPICGVDCVRDTCEHTASFTADASVDEVVAAASALLDRGSGEMLERPLHLVG
jgi:ADP-heptose:LPS heptosyltransferase